jgi:hypothetical protein
MRGRRQLPERALLRGLRVPAQALKRGLRSATLFVAIARFATQVILYSPVRCAALHVSGRQKHMAISTLV